MITVIAKTRNVRHSPFKMRAVANAVKDMPLKSMRSHLKLSTKKAAPYILKTVNSAVANATNNLGLNEADLRVLEIQVTEGRRWKKPKFRARGRMDINVSRYSHIRVVVGADVELGGGKDKKNVQVVKENAGESEVDDSKKGLARRQEDGNKKSERVSKGASKKKKGEK